MAVSSSLVISAYQEISQFPVNVPFHSFINISPIFPYIVESTKSLIDNDPFDFGTIRLVPSKNFSWQKVIERIVVPNEGEQNMIKK